MKNRHLLTALLLIVLVNAVVLGGVYLNRRGEGEASLTLSERELIVQTNNENSGVSLRLDWNRYPTDRPWFDEQALSEFGFDTEKIKADAEGSYYWRKVLPRQGFVVLEYAGEAWRSWQVDTEEEIVTLERDAEAEADDDKRERIVSRIARKREQLQTNSRLFVVDAGPDPQRLRQNYPDRTRFAISAARVRVYSSHRKGEKPVLKGTIMNLLVSSLHVPKSLQTPLAGSDPVFTAQVHWGQRYEPWIESISKR